VFRLYSSLNGFDPNDYIAELTLPEVSDRLVTQRVMSVLLGQEFEDLEESVIFRVYGYSGIDLGTDANLLPGGGLSNITSVYQFGDPVTNVTFDGSGSDVIVSGTVEALIIPPTVSTDAPSSVSTTSATLGGSVTEDGGAIVTERGIVYSTSPNPTTGDNVVQMGDGTGSFSQSVTGLDPGTTYYVRAYATNSQGTNYGSQQSITTLVTVISIVRHDPTSPMTNENEVVYRVLLSGPVAGLSPSNFTVATTTGALISDISGSGSTYDVTVNTGSGNEVMRLDLTNSTGVSPEIIELPFEGGDLYVIDKTKPEVAISSPETSPTNSDPIPLEITFTKVVSGFTVDDITVTGGTPGNFDGDGASYTVDITPDGEGTIIVNIAAGVAHDMAGNYNEAADPFSIVFNNTGPLVAITSPETNPTNASPIPIEIQFSEDVTGFVIGDISVTGGSPSNFNGSGGNYTVDITPDADGTITVDINAGVAQDEAGNDNEAATQFSIVSDQTPPTITSITAQQSSPTNETGLEFVLVFSEDVQAPVAGDFDITNASFQSVVGSGDTFTLVVNPDDPSGEATITVEVLQGGVEDLAGNALSNSDSESVDYDGLAPEIADHAFFDSSSEEIDGITNDDTFTLEIEFDEDLDIASFEAGSLTITNDNPEVSDNILTGHSISGNTLTLELVIPEAERDNIAAIELEISDGLVTDLAGNEWTGSETFQIVYNGTRPTVTISTNDGVTNEPLIPIVIEFSEEMA
ncbi:Ig-like domain-containing protein, partial [Balneolaceae bacterium ANBcel3]|nr:Ig-like domain-containing protein [Balneolaceae bacterium ANBcel3]